MTESLAQEAYVAFVQICKGGSDDAGTYDADEALVRRALKRLDELESAALAEPEPEGPPQPVPVLPEGTPIIEPPDHTLLVPIAQLHIPVSERLPGPEDCDALGYCWWYDHRESAWIECDVPFGQRCGYRHWLPAHALPLPSGEAQQ